MWHRSDESVLTFIYIAAADQVTWIRTASQQQLDSQRSDSSRHDWSYCNALTLAITGRSQPRREPPRSASSARTAGSYVVHRIPCIGGYLRVDHRSATYALQSVLSRCTECSERLRVAGDRRSVRWAPCLCPAAFPADTTNINAA